MVARLGVIIVGFCRQGSTGFGLLTVNLDSCFYHYFHTSDIMDFQEISVDFF